MSARHLALGAVLAASLLTAAPAWANLTAATEAEAAVLARADTLLELREWQRACTLLESSFGASPANLQAVARLGECRTGLGQYGRAMADYTRILQQVDAPIIVARLLVLEAAASSGVIVVEQVPEALPPAMLSGEASLGVLFDSNANAGTSASSVQAMLGAFPILLNLNPASQGQPDNALTLGLSTSYLQPLSAQFALVLRADIGANLYTVDASHSRQFARGTAGVIFREGPFSANLQGDFGVNWRNGAVDQTSAGLGARASLALTPQLSLGVSGFIGRFDLPADADRNSVLRSATAGVQYELAPGLSANLDYVISRSEAGSPLYSYWSHGPRLGVSAVLAPQIGLDLSYSYEMAAYDDSLAMFPQGREDRTHQLGAMLTFDLSDAVAQGMSASLGYTYRHTDSSIDLHDVERHAVTAAVRYAF